MRTHDWKRLFDLTSRLAREYLEGLEQRPVRPASDAAGMLAALERSVPDEGRDAETVVSELAASLGPGLCAMPSGPCIVSTT